LNHPVVIGYQPGSFLVSTVYGVFAIPWIIACSASAASLMAASMP
jgi:hypothetical protein